MTVDGGHRVATYDDLGALAADVADFVVHSLEQDRPVATITRPDLRRAVHARLASLGVDVAQARRDGFLVTLDAEATMRRFMVGGHPDPDRFAMVVGSLAPDGQGPFSAFGEMVAVLWERGEVVAALELEGLWNTALAAHPFRLLCAYPAELLARARLGDVARLCDLHDHIDVIGATSGAVDVDEGALVAVSDVQLPLPQAVAAMRGFVREVLTTWRLDHVVDDVELVTSELATNAVTHGSSPFLTSLVQGHGVVRVEVEDGSSLWPQPHDAGVDDQDGRGMAIVAALSQRSGCTPTPGGKIAWAEVGV